MAARIVVKGFSGRRNGIRVGVYCGEPITNMKSNVTRRYCCSEPIMAIVLVLVLILVLSAIGQKQTSYIQHANAALANGEFLRLETVEFLCHSHDNNLIIITSR